MTPRSAVMLPQRDPAVAPPAATRCILHPSALGSRFPVVDDVHADFAFRATDYYVSLIDWHDPADPIRKLIVPSEGERIDFGESDASDEASNTVVPGLQHKYADTALMLITDQCAGFCRYCFRKRLFREGARETLRDWEPAVRYVARHPEITDVLLSGGDPLTLSTKAIAVIVRRILEIDHVRTIRVGSKVPAFNPSRITRDAELAELVAEVVASGRSLYVITHFDHPRELTPRAVGAVAALRQAGAMCLNQCPVTSGINDDPGVLAELFQSCTDAGCPQYYVFQCRPTTGNSPFVMPLIRAFEIVEDARTRVSGLSRRARLCLSHASGKIEVVGTDDRRIYARYHRPKRVSDMGRMLVFQRDDEAYWMDHLVPVSLD